MKTRMGPCVSMTRLIVYPDGAAFAFDENAQGSFVSMTRHIVYPNGAAFAFDENVHGVFRFDDAVYRIPKRRGIRIR